MAVMDFMFREYGGTGVSGTPPIRNVEYTKKLVVVGENVVWYESSAGTMSVLADSLDDLDITTGLDMFEAFGKAFIVNDTNLKIADFTNVKLHTTDIQPSGKVYPRHGTVITGDSSGAKMVVDYITDLDGDTYVYGKLITTATFVDTDVCEVTIDEGDVSFTLDADQVDGPHWYNWTTYGNLADDDTTFGELPSRATIGCLYRGRTVIAGNPEYPHQWYMQRQANPFDALYGINDAQTAVAGNNTDMGEVGDIIKAIISYKDDYLVIGCVNQLWYMLGDPATGGSLNELDLTTGIMGSKAWCWDGMGNLYIMSTRGLLRIPPGFGQLENLTEISYPKFITELTFNDSLHRISMGFDRDNNGIVICKTTLADGTNSNWWYDLRTGGLFPESYPNMDGVYSLLHYESVNPTYRKLLFGCFDGFIRYFNNSLKSDNVSGDNAGVGTEAIDSYVCFGPLPLAGENKEGKLTSLTGILAGGGINGSQTDSDDVNYKIFTGLSAAKVLERLVAGTSPDISGTITAPGRRRGTTKRQTVRGAFVGIRAGNDNADESWALERFLVSAKELGRIK